MSAFSRIVWWSVYIVGAIIIQQSIPGVDALTPGFLLSLQERKPTQTFWLFLLFVFIQEGAGSLTFGSAILWYGGQIFLFHLSARMFVSDNLLFVAMLSVSLGAYRGLLAWFMCAVQNIPVEYPQILTDGLCQTMLIPAIWGVAYFTRKKALSHAQE